MAPAEFSLRLQKGITGGFAPPTPEAIHTIATTSSARLMNVSSFVRPLGTPSLEAGLPKSLAIDDANGRLVDELVSILKDIPTESPQGSEDIYGLDTSIAFQSGEFEWCNGGPEGCGAGGSSVQATDADKAKFNRAVEIVLQLVAASA